MRYRIAGLGLIFGAHALAATLTGTVVNGTTGQPAAGDQVLLITVVSGRGAVTGRAITDSSGRFQFAVGGQSENRMVRVIHQRVGYQKAAAGGAAAVVFRVFDAAEKLAGVTATSYVQRLQTEGSKLQVIEEITVRNASAPPRTLSDARPFEIQLAAGAEVIAGKMQRPGGRPVTFKPLPSGQPNQYYFPVPLLPGETRFAVAYQLPYQGEALFEPKISLPLERVTVLLPKTMKFEGKVAGMFQPKPEASQGNVQVTEAVGPVQAPAFHVSGTGGPSQVHAQPAAASGARATPGGAKGTSPGPSSPLQYRWFMLGAVSLVLAGAAAGFLAHKRKRPVQVS